MFTGIIEKTGKILKVEWGAESLKIRVETGFSDLQAGESVAVNGVCLTVEDSDTLGRARFDVSEETQRKTHLGQIQPGAVVNLERALTLQTRLSGHWVQGHVDGLGKFLRAVPEGSGYRADFEVPENLSKYCVEKGSIAIDGVSLTIGQFEDRPNKCGAVVTVFLVPFTWNHTRLSTIQPNESINVEVDILAKYAERLLQKR